jgi:hypothetical protein
MNDKNRGKEGKECYKGIGKRQNRHTSTNIDNQ